MLKCITETEVLEILREVHGGTCGSHLGPRALAAKVIRQGFYWPMIICTANQVTRSCKACQKFPPPPLRRPFAIYQAHRPHLATSAMGAGHHMATTYGSRKPKIHLRRHRIFYQMDRGQSSLHDNSEDCAKILLAKHRLPVRGPVRANSRQRQTV
jgi:hypothetical protein